MNMSWDPRPPLKRAYARVSAGLFAGGGPGEYPESCLDRDSLVRRGRLEWPPGISFGHLERADSGRPGGRKRMHDLDEIYRERLPRRRCPSVAPFDIHFPRHLSRGGHRIAAYFIHRVTHHVAHPMYRPPPPNAWDRWFARDLKDTANGDFYYLVNIFFIPFQTALVVIGGLVAWRTLGQGHKFKQYDVESSCIKEYLAIENQLATATGDAVPRGLRQYWVLMLYEYYWWRQDLLSRAIFTNWCEFRRQRFAKNENFPAGLPFANYLAAYSYFRRLKVFPKNGPFDKLMRYLIRHRHRPRPITWYEIEYFRHGFRPPI
jgi:hypothetical protein